METRFWSKVKVASPSECWEWIAGTNGSYGQFTINSKECKAHRVSYELHHKTTIPEGLIVRHKCDNPPCVNPAHLELGTSADNMRDMEERGRGKHPVGMHHGKSKLTDDDVREIKRLLPTNSTYTIAKLFNIHPGTIGQIKRGQTWKHVMIE